MSDPPNTEDAEGDAPAHSDDLVDLHVKVNRLELKMRNVDQVIPILERASDLLHEATALLREIRNRVPQQTNG